MSYEWSELAYLELQAGNTAMIVFAFSIVMVFLVLAAQFESWSMPLAMILSVPLCILGALIGVNVAGMDINIFTQIGLVVLVGLASKNAILIVEFAKVIRRSGHPIREATLEACRLRLRPIIMTSMAFILGVLPLLFAQGAGAEMRRSLGMAVFSGMLGVTFFGILLTPVFFYLIDTVSESSLFASPEVRTAGRIVLLGVISLAFPPMLLVYAIRSWRSPATGPRTPVIAPLRNRRLIPWRDREPCLQPNPSRSSSWNRSDDPVFSQFFIDRPIFAAVLSIVITLAGGISLTSLPVAQYPDITPPTVEVSAYYPGANAQVVADTVAAPIEQQVNGVENMMYMSSQCTNDGTYTLTVTFRPDVKSTSTWPRCWCRTASRSPSRSCRTWSSGAAWR